MVNKMIFLNIWDIYCHIYASRDELEDNHLSEKLGYEGQLNVIITKNDTKHFKP